MGSVEGWRPEAKPNATSFVETKHRVKESTRVACVISMVKFTDRSVSMQLDKMPVTLILVKPFSGEPASRSIPGHSDSVETAQQGTSVNKDPYIVKPNTSTSELRNGGAGEGMVRGATTPPQFSHTWSSLFLLTLFLLEFQNGKSWLVGFAILAK